VIYGESGDDQIATGDSVTGDIVYGGTGDDIIWVDYSAASGTFYLYGDDGDDWIRGTMGGTKDSTRNNFPIHNSAVQGAV
jgi:hypothetical protein